MYIYLNEDQFSHMRHIAQLPPEQRCRCGWNRRGDCHSLECRRAQEEEERQHALQQDVMSDDGCPHHPHDDL